MRQRGVTVPSWGECAGERYDSDSGEWVQTIWLAVPEVLAGQSNERLLDYAERGLFGVTFIDPVLRKIYGGE